MNKRMHKILKAASIILLIGVFFISLGFLTEEAIFWQKIKYGIHLGSLNLGGQTKVEAKENLLVWLNQARTVKILVTAETKLGSKEISLPLFRSSEATPASSEKLIDPKLDDTIESAYLIGRQGTLGKKFIEIIKHFFVPYSIDFQFQWDREEIEKFLQKQFAELTSPVLSPHLSLEEKNIVLMPGQNGIIFDYQREAAAIEKRIRQANFTKFILTAQEEKSLLGVEDCKDLYESLKETVENNNFFLIDEVKKWPISPAELVTWIKFKKASQGIVKIDLDRDQIIAFLKPIKVETELPVLEPKFKLVENRLAEFVPPQTGKTINLENTIFKIEEALQKNQSEIQISFDYVKPKGKLGETNDFGIREKVGYGESDFRNSPVNRLHNIRVGMEKISGILIKPNEEFSLVKAIGPVEESTGFLPELVIKGSKVTPESGGGLCQIGTTVFRLALNAGLPITQRANHSFRVIYYEPAGMDATIYNPQPDLKFVNDTKNYLVIQGKIQGHKLIFEFYGTSDGRKVELTQPILFNLVPPPEKKIIYTDALKDGEKKKAEGAVAGADASFTRKIIYADDTSKEETWKSHYVPWPEMWLVGGKDPSLSTTSTTPVSSVPVSQPTSTGIFMPGM